MRQPAQRRADLRAQLAANRVGVARLEAMDAGPLRAAMAAVLDYSERRMRAAIEGIDDGVRGRADVLEAREGDLVLRLRAEVRGDRLTLDFTGSAAQHEGNLNCPLAVTRSACYFAVRVLTDPDIPPTRRRLPADRRASPPRARCSTRARPRRWSAATSRRPRGSPTSCSPRSGGRSARGR